MQRTETVVRFESLKWYDPPAVLKWGGAVSVADLIRYPPHLSHLNRRLDLELLRK